MEALFTPAWRGMPRLPGAAVAALATFLPCYLLTILPAPYFKKYGKQPGVVAFVDADAQVLAVQLDAALGPGREGDRAVDAPGVIVAADFAEILDGNLGLAVAVGPADIAAGPDDLRGRGRGERAAGRRSDRHGLGRERLGCGEDPLYGLGR